MPKQSSIGALKNCPSCGGYVKAKFAKLFPNNLNYLTVWCDSCHFKVVLPDMQSCTTSVKNKEV